MHPNNVYVYFPVSSGLRAHSQLKEDYWKTSIDPYPDEKFEPMTQHKYYFVFLCIFSAVFNNIVREISQHGFRFISYLVAHKNGTYINHNYR